MAVLAVICFLPNKVMAEDIINNNNVVISESDYQDFSKIHTDAYIMTMTQEKYNELKTFDYDTVRSNTKYIETGYNQNLGIYTSRELTEAEYNNINPSSPPRTRTTGSDMIETAYKKLTLSLTDSGSLTNCTVTCTWKIIPATRSFDVNGLRLQGYGMVAGAQNGHQIYYTNGSYQSVSYASNGTNIKILSNGFGISMNLVNNSITYLQSTTESSLIPGTGTKAVYGTYQHSTADLTLAQSRNYTIGVAGLGGVFVYPYSISQHYDNMNGVQVLG